MPNPVHVFVVQEHGGAVVRADLVESVPGEILVAHDYFVAEVVERLLHAVEVPLELLLGRLPPAFEQLLALVRFYGRSYRQVTPLG